METVLREPHAVYEAMSISQAEAEDAHNQKLHCIQIYNERGRRDYQLGEKLNPIDLMFEHAPDRAESLYGFPEFRQLLEAPRDSGGLDIPYSTAMRAMRLYSLITRFDLNPEIVAGLDYTKIDMLGKVMTQENADAWLIKARDLSRDDLRKELSEDDKEPRITTHRRITDMDATELRGVIKALRRYVREVFINNAEYKKAGQKILEAMDSMIEFE